MFNVPGLSAGDPSTATFTIWDGIDGWGNGDLIQAGVEVSYTYRCQGSTVAAVPDTGTAYACPWIMTFANGGGTWAAQPDLDVSVGDSVEVGISQLSGSNWQVVMTDRTLGGTAITPIAYSGPASTAEWIVEDPGFSAVPCGQTALVYGRGQCPMPPYAPAASFSALDLSPTSAVDKASALTMTVNGVPVATPSMVADVTQLLSKGFAVTWSGPAAA
jgi:hypothetical protein